MCEGFNWDSAHFLLNSNSTQRNKLNLNPSKTQYQIFNCKTEEEK